LALRAAVFNGSHLQHVAIFFPPDEIFKVKMIVKTRGGAEGEISRTLPNGKPIIKLYFYWILFCAFRVRCDERVIRLI
jgi:hypothetical protein